MKRAILYARVSSQRQSDKDLSIPSQFEQMRRYCQERNWEIVEEIADEAVSGRRMRRKGLQRILSMAQTPPCPFNVLLVWKLSRLARNLRDAVNLEYELKQKGIEVISVSEPVEDTPLGESFRGMIHIVNQLFSLQLAEDTTKGLLENARLGYWNGGNYPLGYRAKKIIDERGNIKTKLEIDPVYAEVVERIFQMYLSGMGFKAIAIALNKEGLKTNYNKPFSIYATSKILRDEVYTGTYRWGNPPNAVKLENAYPAIISPETFHQVQEIIASRATLHPRIIASDYLLSGLLICGKCGWKLTGSSTSYLPVKSPTGKEKKYRYYYCGTYKRMGKELCDMKAVQAENVESRVLENIKNHLLHPEEIKKIFNAVKATAEKAQTDIESALSQKRHKHRDVEQRLQNVYDALETGKLPIDIIAPRIRELTAFKRQLETEIFQLEKQKSVNQPISYSEMDIESHVRNLEKLFASGTLAEKRAFLHSFVSKVTVNANGSIQIEWGIG